MRRSSERIPSDGDDVVGELAWSTEPSSTGSGFKLVAKTRRAGQTLRSALDASVVGSGEFQKMIRLAAELAEFGPAPYSLTQGDREARDVRPDHFTARSNPRDREQGPIDPTLQGPRGDESRTS